MGTPADTTSDLNVAVPTTVRANARLDPLGGVDGDPDPVPQAVYVSRAGEPEPLEPAVVEDPPEAPSPSWQQRVDAHRADFGLPALAPAPAVQEDEAPPDGARIARLTARRAAAKAVP